MRKILLTTTLFFPLLIPTAFAQGCGNYLACNSSVSCCAASDDTAFVTKHRWSLDGGGIWALSGTAFTVRYDDSIFTFSVYWRDKLVHAAPTESMDAAKYWATTRANDLQEMGKALQ